MKVNIAQIKFLLSEKLTLYPSLVGILFLVNELRKSSVFNTTKESFYLVIIVLLFSLFIDFVCKIIIKNKLKAALIAASFIFINLFYRDILLAIFNNKFLIGIINSLTSNHPQYIVIPLILIIWITFAFFVISIKRIPFGINLWLNVVIIAFIFFEISQLIFSPVEQITLTDNKPFLVNNDLSLHEKPDIYYIILDSYTSSESLSKYWNYDNAKFEDSLTHLGFFIVQKSKTKYTSTPYCIASYLNSSSLNIDYKKKYNERNLTKLIKNNRLYNWLKQNKYRCINFSHFEILGSKKNVDIINHFLGRTIWYAIYNKLYHFLNPFLSIPQINLEYFSNLINLAKEDHEKPIFAYAHIMMPHSPYYFNEFGKPFNADDKLTDKQKYLGQLIFTNSLALETIYNILSYSPKNSIIIIQGDHGFRYLDDKKENSKEAHSIFYAIYTPNGIEIPNTINPSNTFKILIDQINN